MDLIAKVGILIVIIVVIAGLGFVLFTHAQPLGNTVTEAQAEALVLSDVNASNPGAAVTVLNATPSTLPNVKSGNWSITLSIIYNATRPCPALSIASYVYPALHFVPNTENQYTIYSSRVCIINGLSTAPTFVISSPYLAIARSYNSLNSAVVNYVNDNGYNNTQAHARFYPNLAASATPLNMSYSNVWLVNYTSHNAGYSQFVVLGQSGSVLANYTQK